MISSAWVTIRRKTAPVAVSPESSAKSDCEEPKNWFDRKSFRLSALGVNKKLPSLQSDEVDAVNNDPSSLSNSESSRKLRSPPSAILENGVHCANGDEIIDEENEKLGDNSSKDPIHSILHVRPLQDVCYCCIIHKPWLDRWRLFVQAGSHEDIEYPQSPPGPISNFRLLCRDSPHRKAIRDASNLQSPNETTRDEVVLNEHLLVDLRIDYDYLVVSPGVWRVLSDMYGGGPPIFRCDVNIYGAVCDASGDVI
mmetsp:Transcript_5780/g.8800  ORF Transcript_5780/g.8800 Transcript_5780/m.8800 type:complete len:253 (-) Transcript_5780:126-884(-)